MFRWTRTSRSNTMLASQCLSSLLQGAYRKHRSSNRSIRSIYSAVQCSALICRLNPAPSAMRCRLDNLNLHPISLHLTFFLPSFWCLPLSYMILFLFPVFSSWYCLFLALQSSLLTPPSLFLSTPRLFNSPSVLHSPLQSPQTAHPASCATSKAKVVGEARSRG